ncbi:hypothetical protein NKDENANG_00011 [Candidatus Entotheonellaceae bacterium PAL068K]
MAQPGSSAGSVASTYPVTLSPKRMRGVGLANEVVDLGGE